MGAEIGLARVRLKKKRERERERERRTLDKARMSGSLSCIRPAGPVRFTSVMLERVE